MISLAAVTSSAAEPSDAKDLCQWPVPEGEFPLMPCGKQSLAAANRLIAICTGALADGKSHHASLYSSRGRAYVQRLFCNGDRTDFDRAVSDLGVVISHNPAARDAFAARGLAYEYTGDHGRAVLDYRAAYRIGIPPKWLVERLESFEASP
jgi:tetratricopeptide (TPR) repeat protein